MDLCFKLPNIFRHKFSFSSNWQKRISFSCKIISVYNYLFWHNFSFSSIEKKKKEETPAVPLPPSSFLLHFSPFFNIAIFCSVVSIFSSQEKNERDERKRSRAEPNRAESTVLIVGDWNTESLPLSWSKHSHEFF